LATLDPADWGVFRTLAHRMVDDMLDRLQALPEVPAWQYIPEETERTILDESLPCRGQGEVSIGISSGTCRQHTGTGDLCVRRAACGGCAFPTPEEELGHQMRRALALLLLAVTCATAEPAVVQFSTLGPWTLCAAFPAYCLPDDATT